MHRHSQRREFLRNGLGFGVGCWMAGSGRAIGGNTDHGLQIAPFSADITPPMGEPLVAGLLSPASQIEHPLLAKGVVLRDNGGTYVLCSLDLCGVCNGSYERLREGLARAAGISASHVALHSIHQHTVPLLDRESEALLQSQPDPPRTMTIDYEDAVIRNVRGAVCEAMGRCRPATHVALSSAKVDRVASSRRVRMPDGKIVARASAARDPKLRELPEGLVDPLLRTITFFDDRKPLVAIHYYATHPQTSGGDGRVTYDVPGIARQRLEKETGLMQVYFTGCGGNVAMGKYNDGTPEAREPLADRLYQAMSQSLKAGRPQPVSSIAWRTVEFRPPRRTGEKFSEPLAQQTIADPKQSSKTRILAAKRLAWNARVKAGRPLEVGCLRMGPLRLVHLPGEVCVEYQLWAQQLCPTNFVAVAAYGDLGIQYVCIDQAYKDVGGYEQTVALADPCESLLKRAIAEVLST